MEKTYIDEIMHKIGFISGKLDVVEGGGKESAYVKLCQECSKELSNIAREYWIKRGGIENDDDME